MSIQVAWYNDEKSVLVYSYKGTWDMEEFYKTYNQGARMMDEVQHPVSTVFDLTSCGPMPSGFMGTIRDLSQNPHDNLDHMFIVGANPFVQGFVNLLGRVIPRNKKGHRTFFVSTIEDAVARVAEVSRQEQPR